ncbi:MAG: hypothetical protein ABIR57_02835, partial [Aeromicrobium sp.]
SPAFAADELALSVDGVHWTQSISDPLFDESMRWVPGDSETATFYIRNQGGTAGDLTVDVIGSQAGQLLESGDLHITARGGGGMWSVVSAPGNHRLLSAPNIPDGQVSPIDLNVSFDATSTNPTRLRSAELTFRVTLSESAAGGSGSNGSSSSGLPGAGAAELRWYSATGALLIGIGMALVLRRREGESSHV